MLPPSLSRILEKQLSQKKGQSVSIRRYQFQPGGYISQTGILHTNAGMFFLKWNSAWRFPGIFTREVEGLGQLAQAGAIRTPEVLDLGEVDHHCYLLLEYIAGGQEGERFWEELGQGLAAQHRILAPEFGLSRDNYFGSLPQSNRRHRRWEDFFREERIAPLTRLALEQGKITAAQAGQIEALYPGLGNRMPSDEPPALLHGDLWSGNLLASREGHPVLVDPAVYFGNREMELAYARSFGRFSEQFFAAYEEAYPLQPGFNERIPLYNLYPILLHVLLFGREYQLMLDQTLRQI